MWWKWKSDVTSRLDRIEKLLQKQGVQMAIDFTKIEASLQAEADAETAVEQLLVTLSDEIKTLSSQSTDPAVQTKLNDLASQIDARTATLSAAIVANTPAGNP